MKENKKSNGTGNSIGVGAAIGLAVVLAYKIISKDTSLNMALGIAIGAAVGAAFDWVKAKKNIVIKNNFRLILKFSLFLSLNSVWIFKNNDYFCSQFNK